jgi:hypothetical protein
MLRACRNNDNVSGSDLLILARYGGKAFAGREN